MNLKWRYKNKKGKNDFVAASKKTGKQNLKICACNLALLPAIYRKILSTWTILSDSEFVPSVRHHSLSKNLKMDSFYFRFTVQLITLLMSCNRTPLHPIYQVIIPAYYRCELLGCVVKPKLHITVYLKILKSNDVTFSAGSIWENLNSATTANCWKKKVLWKDEGYVFSTQDTKVANRTIY